MHRKDRRDPELGPGDVEFGATMLEFRPSMRTSRQGNLHHKPRSFEFGALMLEPGSPLGVPAAG